MSTSFTKGIGQSILRILIVDDDAVDRMALKRALQHSGFEVSIAEAVDAETALEMIDDAAYDCLFLDYNLPGRNGVKLTQRIRSLGIRTPLIALTGQGNEQTAVDLMKAGASDYLPKSKLSSDVISRLIRSALRVFEAEMLAEKANIDLREKNALLEKTNRELERQRHHICRQNLKLQEVSQLKSEFLAMMSHELRTPLNAIIGFSQILLSEATGPLTSRPTDMLSRVLANGRNLLELIDDILAFSKIEAGRLDLRTAKMDLARLVNSTLEELRPLATQKCLTLEVTEALSNPMVINDVMRFRQILVNLLSNAIKFTDVGAIHVTVQDQPERADQNDEILLTVTDTGCGISAKAQLHIFDPFHQANQKATRRHEGTGLGLAITRSLVKMMNGHITLESELGQGTTFTVALPRKVVSMSDNFSGGNFISPP